MSPRSSILPHLHDYPLGLSFYPSFSFPHSVTAMVTESPPNKTQAHKSWYQSLFPMTDMKKGSL